MDENLKKDFINYLVRNKDLRINSASTYISRIKMFEKKYELDNVTNDDIVTYLSEMKLKSIKNNTNTRRLAKTALETFYAWYAPQIGISNPAKGLKKIREYISSPDMVHPDEIEKMLYSLDRINNEWSRRACAIIAMLADTGIRIGEMIKIKFGDVRLLKDNFEVIIASIKSNNSRIIPFSNLKEGGIGEYFSRYYEWVLIEKEQNKNAPLFFQLKHKNIEENKNKYLGRDGIKYAIDKAIYEANITRSITPHMFRHFYATYTLINGRDKGIDIITLSYLMGHSNIHTTQRYIHIADKISGKLLKYSATSNIKAERHRIGYSKILQGIN